MDFFIIVPLLAKKSRIGISYYPDHWDKSRED